ncbi:MAG TPA: T9SS type A sorting domain-containing protein [Chitinophagales bacterium]|nr:T9SS type A sorting domain-containing protein [Chitinophagales bacterium]
MKKFFTLLVGFVALSLTTNAQTNPNARTSEGTPTSHKQPIQVQKKVLNKGTSRASTEVIALDYDAVDDAYTGTSGGDYSVYAWDINARYKPTDVLTMKFAAVIYDTLLYLDANDNQLFIPRSQASFVLDSFDMLVAHENVSATNDTVTVTVFNRTGLTATGVGTPTGALNTSSLVLWDTVIVTNASLAGGGNYGVLSFYPNLSFATNQTFGIRVDYAGDTADKFQLAIGSRDDCVGDCLAAPSAAGFNTFSFLNWDGQFPNTGLYTNQIFFDCNGTGDYEEAACENIFLQNAKIVPYLTVNVNYGAVISADSLNGCPGGILTLNANAFGSAAPNYTYAWSTTDGTLTSTTDQIVDLVVGNNDATVTVTVTDGNNQTTVATASIDSRGVAVNFTGSNPLTLNCGSSATLVTQLTGVTTGKFYSWSTGVSGSNTSTISVNTAGTYTVTVTNNAGCSATSSLTVQYPGGVTNNVTFTNPPAPVCEDRPVTFTNTSTNQTGWTPQWTFDDGNIGFTMNGTNTYTNPGVYKVQLQMTDANGCIFKSPLVNLTVLPASNGACINGIEDVTFGNAISMQPNPSNGNVSITVNGVEKNVSVRVFNIIGSMVKMFNSSDVASTFTKSFDFSDLANGTYLVKIQSGDKTAVKRLTISK